MDEKERAFCWLTRKEASSFLKHHYGIQLGPDALAKLAYKGNGPLYRRDGKFALYGIKHLKRWATARLSPVVSKASELECA